MKLHDAMNALPTATRSFISRTTAALAAATTALALTLGAAQAPAAEKKAESEAPAPAKKEESKEATQKVEKKKVEEKITTVVVKGMDNMQYDKKKFEVNAGEKVRVTLKNIGVIPKVAMGHNLIVLKKSVKVDDLAAFANAAVLSPMTEYIPASEKEKIIAHTKMLGPGESDTIEFTAPKEKGDYFYICSFPGHYILMRGVMTVK